MADEIFRGIKDYAFLANSHYITDSITVAVSQGRASVLEYMKNRLKPIKHSFGFHDAKTQYAIHEDVADSNNAMGDYGALETKIWMAESLIIEEMFDENAANPIIAKVFCC